jgi:hypothetical protein
MPWSDVDQLHPLQACFPQLHALVIHAYGRDLRSHGFEYGCRTGIPRILHAHPISGIQEQPRHEVERFLHSGDDRYLLGDTLHPTRSAQVGGHSLPQHRISHRTAAQQKICRDTPQTTCRDLRP